MISDEINYYFKEVETKEEFLRYFNLRYKVYCEQKKWISSGKYPDKLEMDAYDDSAKHFIALNDDFKIVGCIRFLFGRDYGKLPYQAHPGVKKKNLDVSNQVEISRLIINGEKNNFALVKGLFRVAYAVGKIYLAKNWIMLAEPSLLRFLARVNHYFRPICPPAKYFGSLTYPAICNIVENDEILKRKFPKEYRYFNEDYRIVTIGKPSKVLI